MPAQPKRRLVPGAKSLAARFPTVAAQWHPTANAPLTPADVRPWSNERVTWGCPTVASHVWQAAIRKRTEARASGCPKCALGRVTPENSLLACHPEIARQWHPTKNGDLGPGDVSRGSDKKVWWQCRKDPLHAWEVPVCNRTHNGLGCPMCTGRVVTPARSLAGRFPKVATEWHPTRNGELTPAGVMPGSLRRVWWRCRRDPSHEWRAPLNSRTRKESPTRCPVCMGRVVTPATSFAACFSEVAKDWHPTKNGRLTPDDFLPHSQKKVWWRCRRDPSHDWRSRLADRTREVSPSGCPACSGRVVTPATSLAARFPAVAAEWHPTKNRYLQPDSVMAGSGRKVWWQCRKDPAHAWRAKINHRTLASQKSGCPFCAHQRVSATTSLAARFPAVAAEWHPTKNGKLKPAGVMPGSIKKAWWRCAHNRAHEWEAGVSSRTRGSGCPQCYRDSRKPRALRGTARAAPDPALRGKRPRRREPAQAARPGARASS